MLIICLHTCCASIRTCKNIDSSKITRMNYTRANNQSQCCVLIRAVDSNFYGFVQRQTAFCRNLCSIFFSSFTFFLVCSSRRKMPAKLKKIPSDFRACNICPASNYDSRTASPMLLLLPLLLLLLLLQCNHIDIFNQKNAVSTLVWDWVFMAFCPVSIRNCFLIIFSPTGITCRSARKWWNTSIGMKNRIDKFDWVDMDLVNANRDFSSTNKFVGYSFSVSFYYSVFVSPF